MDSQGVSLDEGKHGGLEHLFSLSCIHFERRRAAITHMAEYRDKASGSLARGFDTYLWCDNFNRSLHPSEAMKRRSGVVHDGSISGRIQIMPLPASHMKGDMGRLHESSLMLGEVVEQCQRFTHPIIIRSPLYCGEVGMNIALLAYLDMNTRMRMSYYDRMITYEERRSAPDLDYEALQWDEWDEHMVREQLCFCLWWLEQEREAWGERQSMRSQ